MDISETDDGNADRIKLLWNSNSQAYWVIQTGVGNVALTGTGWKHLALVFDGTQTGNVDRLVGYIDGSAQVLSFAGTVPAVLPTFTETLSLGFDNGSGNYGDGVLDEVTVWDGTALSASEILEIYNSGCPAHLRDHSQWAALSHWWAMGDNFVGPGTIPDMRGSSDATMVNMDATNITTNVPCP